MSKTAEDNGIHPFLHQCKQSGKLFFKGKWVENEDNLLLRPSFLLLLRQAKEGFSHEPQREESLSKGVVKNIKSSFPPFV